MENYVRVFMKPLTPKKDPLFSTVQHLVLIIAVCVIFVKMIEPDRFKTKIV